MILEQRIQQAIESFEKYNNLSICDFRAFGEEKSQEDTRLIDNYIAESKFAENIKAWLDICENIDSKSCAEELLALLSRFTYFTENTYYSGFEKLLKCISEKTDYCFDKMLFVTIASPNHCCSGGDKVRSALSVIFRGDISKSRILNYSHEKISNNNNIELVVFIDDIIGSGFTIYRTVKEFYKRNRWLKHKKVCIACLCGREKKVKLKAKELNKLGLDVVYLIHNTMKKCIDELRILNNKTSIYSIEEKINKEFYSHDYAPDKNCVMGFAKSQMLVSFFYETPNNTLSVFWMKTDSNPYPVFKRLQSVKPNVSWFKERKKKILSFAYNLFSRRNHK